MRRTTCQYCEKELVPNRRGRPKQFCDEVCRRRYHRKSPCEVCGAPSWERRCMKCAQEAMTLDKQYKEAHFWNSILELRKEGWLNHDIARQLKRSKVAIDSALQRMRKAGLPVPDSAYDRDAWMTQWIRRRIARGDVARPTVASAK